MTDIDDIRSRMHGLTDQARRALQLHDVGVIGPERCRELAGRMRAFLWKERQWICWSSRSASASWRSRCSRCADMRGSYHVDGMAAGVADRLWDVADIVKIG
jgi:hypothetical protein